MLMKTLLFPHRFQKVGWIILAISLVVDIYVMVGWWGNGNILEHSIVSGEVGSLMGWLACYGDYVINNIAIIGTVVGTLLVTCSREKVEDEMITTIRHNSLLVALYINYGALIVAALLVYDFDFLNVMLFGMFSILLLFLVVFRYNLWRARKGGADE